MPKIEFYEWTDASLRYEYIIGYSLFIYYVLNLTKRNAKLQTAYCYTRTEFFAVINYLQYKSLIYCWMEE